MRLASHIALQTVCLMGTGTALSWFLAVEAEEALEARADVRDDSRDLVTCARMADAASHLMWTADLVLSGGTSDLASIATDRAEVLERHVLALVESPLRRPPNETGPLLLSDVRALGDLLEDSLEASGPNRDAVLSRLLSAFDARSAGMLERIDRLRRELEAEARSRRGVADARVARATRHRWVVGGLLLLVFLCAWGYLTVVVARPLKGLASRVRAARESGVFEADLDGPCEVEELAAGFSQLVDGLASANANLERTVRERTSELEAALRARSAFLANTSHELRTPMNAILGFTDLLAIGEDDEELRRTYLEHVRASGRHLLSLIEDVLDLSKVDAGRMLIEEIPVDPRELVAEVEAMLADGARRKNLAFEARVASSVPARVVGDPLRLRQILVNLAGNAIKFTGRGRIEVELDWREDRLEVAVRDTGIGIPADKIDAVFGAFEQADKSDTRNFGGTGLGLAISRRLARLMGGDVTAESVEGEGSTFRVSVPARRADTPEPYLEEVRAPLPPSGARVLLVDDVPSNRLLGRRLLERMGLVAEVASDGQEALEKCLRALSGGAPFDGVLMDLQMPVLDGYEATRRLRAAGYAGLILALSAAVLPEQRGEALAAGCDGFLSKPLAPEALERELGERLACLTGSRSTGPGPATRPPPRGTRAGRGSPAP